MLIYLSCAVLACGLLAYLFCYYRAQTLELTLLQNNRSSDKPRLRSRPHHHGLFGLTSTVVPATLLILIFSPLIQWLARKNTLTAFFSGSAPSEQKASFVFAQIASATANSHPFNEKITTHAKLWLELTRSYQSLLCLVVGLLTLICLYRSVLQVTANSNARAKVERAIRIGLASSAALAILVTIGIVFSLLFESLRFFQLVPLHEFLFGTKWSPQTALRADQVGSSGAFGAIPLFAGTLLITAIAMLVAVPLGLLAAIYLSEFASSRIRAWAKPMLEILAGVPTVVYGFFAALTVAPLVQKYALLFGMSASSESALAAGSVMGVMIIPFVSSLSDDVINAVPQSLRNGALALGSTKTEMITRIVLPAALPGITASFILAVSRAIGETMIVVMAAGLAANLTLNPFENVTTVTVQIVTALVGDQEFDSAKTLSVFALGMVLFLLTLILNIGAYEVVRRYKEEYE